jgi:hypothetical protein
MTLLCVCILGGMAAAALCELGMLICERMGLL